MPSGWSIIGRCLGLFAARQRWKRQQSRRKNPCVPGIQTERLEPRLVLTASSEEQLFVYLLNKIRHDPQTYDDQANLGGLLDGVEARPPLAINADLFDSARFHAVEMADNNYFAHQSAVTGDWPNKMARDQGYDLPHFFTSNNNFIESIAAGNLYGNPTDVLELLIVDEGVPGAGHRVHLLGIDSFNAQATEIGVGHGFNLSSFYDHYWAAHITHSETGGTFLTGVVYQDNNHDQAFSLNEGLGGVTVTIAGLNLSTQTNAAGGWAIQVPGAGTYSVQASGGTFAGTSSTSVQVGTSNREVDFISGVAGAAVDFAASPSGTNEPPVNSLPPGPLLFQEDVSATVTGLSVADPDAGTSNISVTITVSHGSLTVVPGVVNGLSASQISGNNSAQVILTGPLTSVNTTLGNISGLTYRGNTNFNGTDTLTITTSDLGATGTGGPLIDVDSIDLTVAAVNDAPLNTIPAGPLSVVTGTTLNVPGISINDVDLGLENAQVQLSVSHGTLTLRTDVASGLTSSHIANNGTNTVQIVAPRSLIVATLAAAGGLRYVNDIGYVGGDSLSVFTSDLGQSGSGGPSTDEDSLAINVQSVPLPPVLTLPSSSVSSVKRKPVVIGTGATLTDTDSSNYSGGSLTIQISAGRQANDTLTLNKVGSKTGQLNLRSNDVRLGKTVIGRISGGSGTAPLTVHFTANVSVSTVQTVLRNIELKAARGKLLPGNRTISIVATDPTSASSSPQSRDVNVA